MLRKISIAGRIELAVFSVFFVFYTTLGGYLSLVKHFLPGDAISRLVSAWLVWNGTERKLATIGFFWPPLPIVSLLPLALFPPLVQSWMAVVLLSAFCMAAAVILMSKILDVSNVKGVWRWLLAILFGLNPLNVVFGANGMSEAMLVMVLLAAFYTLLCFWDSNRNMYLILSALFFGLLPLVRYELALVSAAAGMLLAIQCWAQRSSLTPQAFRDFLEGRLLAFSSMALYPIFLWSVASWMIVGNPLYYLATDRNALIVAEGRLTGFSIDLVKALSIVFSAWSLSFPVGLAATAVLMFLAWRKRSMKYLGFALIAYVVPLLQLTLLVRRTNYPLLRYFMTTTSWGCLLVAIAIGALQKEYRLSGIHYKVVILAAVLLVLGSNVATAYTFETYQYQDTESDTWHALTTSETFTKDDGWEAYIFGRTLPSLIKPGERILIDTYTTGYAIILGSNNPRLFLDFTDPNYDRAVKDPVSYADYVLVPNKKDTGVFYIINQEFPDLNEKGAPWATLVEGLPTTNMEWKLYKVKKP